MRSDVKNRLNSEANRIFLNLLDFQGIAILLYTFSFSIDTVSTQYTSRHTLQTPSEDQISSEGRSW